jgi:hypothetical protein
VMLIASGKLMLTNSRINFNREHFWSILLFRESFFSVLEEIHSLNQIVKVPYLEFKIDKLIVLISLIASYFNDWNPQG